MGFKWLVAWLVILVTSACTYTDDYQAFRQSHDTIQPGMTFREIFEQGLADYLVLMKVKNIPGSTLDEKQPVSEVCERYVFDIRYARVAPNPGAFFIRIYCNQNLPSSKQVIPEQTFTTREDLLEALNTTYLSWANSMSFTVESPPRSIGGVYDHYEFTIDQDGRVSSVSPIISQ